MIKTNKSNKTISVKRSAGVAPEVNLRDLLHTGDQACKRGDPPLALNPRVAITRSPKIGVSVAPQKGLMSSKKIFIKKKKKNILHTCLISQLTDQVCMLLNRHVFRESPVAMSIRIKRLKAKPINSWNLRVKLCIQRSHSHVE